MVRKKSRHSIGKDWLNNSFVKIILGMVATGSFAIAFGEEKIAQLNPFNASINSECLVENREI